MAPLLKLSRPVVRAAKNVTGLRSYGGGEVGHTIPRFSELPTPQGSWTEAYSKKNAKGNILLLLGVVSFSGVLAHGYSQRFDPLQKSEFPVKKL